MMPFVEVLHLLGYLFRGNGKGIQGTERTLKKGMGSWWRRFAQLQSKECVIEDQVCKGGQSCVQ